jgi:hypothetical protein
MAEFCHYSFRLSVTTPLPTNVGHIPMSPVIDFKTLIAYAGLPGVLDPNSISLLDVVDGATIAYALTEDFAYGDKGRIEWVIENPAHTMYEIRFQTLEKRPPLEPQTYVPMVGTGDLLRYNASEPRPITLASTRLVDITGDGQPDLAGCWNYYHRPGSPISGVVYYPRVGPVDDFAFGDLTRLRYLETPGSADLNDFSGTYIEADFADFTGNGLPDIVFAERGSDTVTFFTNTGDRTESGIPIFLKGASIPVPIERIHQLQAVDVNHDGVLDLIVDDLYIRNVNPAGWPFMPDRPIKLFEQPKRPDQPADAAITTRVICFDLDGDGRADVIRLQGRGLEQTLTWHRNLGGDPPQLGPALPLTGIDLETCTQIAAVADGQQRGFLVQHNAYQNISFYQWTGFEAGQPRFRQRGLATSKSALLIASDQSWPCVCDWDADGVSDLLIGGGYGWPRIVRNRGTNKRPAFDTPQPILADGQPIRVLRDDILYSQHWHNMGYPYPVFVDWDGDGKPDLLGCVEWSVYPFFCHAALEMEAHPGFVLSTVTEVIKAGSV